MTFILKFCIIWIIVGLISTITSVLYDSIVNKIDIERQHLGSIITMILLGFVSAPVAIYFIIDETIKHIRNKGV